MDTETIEDIIKVVKDIFVKNNFYFSDDHLSEKAPAAGVSSVDAKWEPVIKGIGEVTIGIVAVGDYLDILDIFEKIVIELPRRVPHHVFDIGDVNISRGIETGEIDVARFEITIGG